MSERWINLVLKLLAIDRAASASSPSGITSLNHEIRDYSVDDDIIVVSFLRKGSKVFASLAHVSIPLVPLAKVLTFGA